MPDEVWPHDPNEWLPLSSFNGIGFTFRGSTRPDESGRYFATRWFVLLGLPLAPMDRFYLRKASTETMALGVGLTGSGLLLGVLIANYRKKWAPLHTVRWVEAPPSPFEDFGDFE